MRSEIDGSRIIQRYFLKILFKFVDNYLFNHETRRVARTYRRPELQLAPAKGYKCTMSSSGQSCKANEAKRKGYAMLTAIPFFRLSVPLSTKTNSRTRGRISMK